MVRRAQDGDERAFAELVRRHQRAAVRLASTIAGSSAAVDATQEGFLRAHRGLDRFDADRPFRPWLLRIVANAAKNEVRSSARHLRLAGRARSIRIELTVDEDPTHLTDERRALASALARLSIADRTIIALRWFEDLSEAEIAAVLDVRPGTVKSRLSRAMARLREAITTTEEATGDD
ncbi:MAG: sigma-70 family RNA polymerase sigma factor [Actinomycetota bacterium]